MVESRPHVDDWTHKDVYKFLKEELKHATEGALMYAREALLED
jgi:hypothetical protein